MSGKREKFKRKQRRAYKTLKIEAERNSGKIRNRGGDKDMPVFLIENWREKSRQ